MSSNLSWSARKRHRATKDDECDWDDYGHDVVPAEFTTKATQLKMNHYKHKASNMVTTTFQLPGLKPADITISLLHDKLTITGEYVDRQPQEEGKYTVRELPYGKFQRELTIPLGFKPEDFDAQMDNGLLTLTFPKDPPKQEPHHILIR